MARPRSWPRRFDKPAKGRFWLPGITIALGLLHTGIAWGDVLFLKNGKRIVVDRFWEEDDQILFELNGGIFGFSRSLLDRAERDLTITKRPNAPDPAELPSSILVNKKVPGFLEQARQSAREGDLDTALRLYRQALSEAPDSVSVRIEMAELFMERGDLQEAQALLEQAKRLAPDEPTVRELMGDVYYRRGRTAQAIREWQKSLELRPSASVLDRLKEGLRENEEDIDFDEMRRPHFLIRYDGSVNEAIGQEVAAALEQEYLDFAQEFQLFLTSPIQVTIYTNRAFEDEVAGMPSWASAMNDGQIRLPVQGLNKLTPKLGGLLRHELTHSFVNQRTRGNCPAWFQEGLAQWRTGEIPAGLYSKLRQLRNSGTLLPLWTLEGSFLHYSEDKAQLAYMEALAAIEYLTRRGSPSALVQILDQLADQQTMNEALRRVIGLDYQELQTVWEADLDRYRSDAQQIENSLRRC